MRGKFSNEEISPREKLEATREKSGLEMEYGGAKTLITLEGFL